MADPTAPRASSRWWTELRARSRERHVSFLIRYLATLLVTVTVSTLLFNALMEIEGQPHRWWTGVYWTFTTMTTLGLGDVAFTSAAGQLLTVVVLVTGIVFMLVLLPLVLIQFPPWVEARSAARIRRGVRPEVRGHVVLTNLDPVTESLVRKLGDYRTPYVLIVPAVEDAVRLSEEGVHVMLGELDHPETYRAAGLERAALMAATGDEVRNANAVFTARSVAPAVPILATADRATAVDVLELAGSTRVVQLRVMLARALARRVLGGDALAHVVGRFGDLLIAEANAARTPLVGKTLRESNLRDLVPVSIVGVWDRGDFQIAGPDTRIGPHTVLVLAGTREHLTDYDEVFAIYNVSPDPVVVIGGGRVGRAVVASLKGRGIESRIVDSDAALVRGPEAIHGDASDPEVLEMAGIARAPSVVITTADDDTNVFLALYWRRHRPDIQIVSRATFEKNVETLHRAGTDFVLSLASLGASSIFNLLERGDTVTLTEGLGLFRVPIPAALRGVSLARSAFRAETGCSVVAIVTPEGMQVNPDPARPLPVTGEAILVGTREAEARFLERYGS